MRMRVTPGPSGFAPEGQGEGEAAPLARGALDRHPPAVLLRDVLDEGEAEAAAAAVLPLAGPGPVELVEDPPQVGGGNADALVFDLDNDLRPAAPRGHPEHSPVAGVLDRVVDEVGQGLGDGGLVHAHGGKVA